MFELPMITILLGFIKMLIIKKYVYPNSEE